MVRLEELGNLKKCNDLIGTRTSDLSACSIAPQPSPTASVTKYMTEDDVSMSLHPCACPSQEFRPKVANFITSGVVFTPRAI
jgi:hypothetical protein